jgi:hypothetical protein
MYKTPKKFMQKIWIFKFYYKSLKMPNYYKLTNFYTLNYTLKHQKQQHEKWRPKLLFLERFPTFLHCPPYEDLQ